MGPGPQRGGPLRHDHTGLRAGAGLKTSVRPAGARPRREHRNAGSSPAGRHDHPGSSKRASRASSARNHTAVVTLAGALPSPACRVRDGCEAEAEREPRCAYLPADWRRHGSPAEPG